ncbi:MAG TPA: chromate efflux transporter [Candidatus Limnocylindrales bacterium]|nr:chromate efflux transporter [Candidatus Limnocylindrales bacterium]
MLHDRSRSPVTGAGQVLEVFRVALMLGLTSFGGPIAHLGYFHREYVARRRWLSEATYLDLVALCQFLPGPASSQVGIGIGLLRAGWGGALAAWVGFTLPSAVALTAFAMLTTEVDLAAAGWIQGLKLAAVAIVAVAVVSMWRSLAPDWPRRVLAVAAAAAMLLLQTAALQIAVIATGGLLGWWLLDRVPAPDRQEAPSPVGRRAGAVALALFVALLICLPLAVAATGSQAIAIVESFYRAGALVFGGGHVVLPLLSESVVTPGWVSEEAFLAGYGAAQAVPGPLFTFAAYLGVSLQPEPNGIAGAAVALAAIFLPSFLLVIGAFPFWDRLRRSAAFRGALAGTNAAVIGLLIAALYDPVWTSAVTGPVDVLLVALAFAALVVVNAPPWLVVAGLAVAAQLLQLFGVGRVG